MGFEHSLPPSAQAALLPNSLFDKSAGAGDQSARRLTNHALGATVAQGKARRIRPLEPAALF
jgi:hypothetical protein